MTGTTDTANSLVTGDFDILHQTQAIRNQIMDVLTSADLVYRFPNCPSLGELCREIGETQQIYIDSYRTFKTTFEYDRSDPTLATDLTQLKSWYAELDRNSTRRWQP